jgi:hypothetical protein
MQLSPYRAGVAGPYPTRLRILPALQTGSCSLALSGLGKSFASESSALNSGLLRRQFTLCVTRRTLSMSISSPALTNDDQLCFGSPHLAYLTATGHRIACSPSPTLPRTGSPGRWSSSQRHTLQSVCVRPLQPSKLGTTRTPGP